MLQRLAILCQFRMVCLNACAQQVNVTSQLAKRERESERKKERKEREKVSSSCGGKRARAELAGRGKTPVTIFSWNFVRVRVFSGFCSSQKVASRRPLVLLLRFFFVCFVYKSDKGTNCNGELVTPVASQFFFRQTLSRLFVFSG